MTNLKELKDIFVGEVLMVMLFKIYFEVYCYFDEYSSMDWTWEETLICLGWIGFAFITTYAGNILVKGIAKDIAEVKELINKKKTTTK